MLERLLLAGLLAISFACQAAVYSLPWGPKPQFVDANGAPMSGGTLQTFVGSSTTPQVTYTDSTGGVANPTTITLNVRGESPNEVWLTGGVTYKFVLKDSSGSTVWTVDNVSGVNDATNVLDEWKGGPAPTFVSATSFTLVGDQTVEFHKGRRLKTTNSGGTIYSTVVGSVFGASTTVTVANDSSVLDSGLSAVSYGIVRAANPSISPDMVYRKGTAVASATTTNIWGITGDYVHVTGTTTITSLSTAPFAGAERTVIFDGVLTLTHDGTVLQLPGAANIITAAGDRIVVRADTTANMIVTAYMPARGPPVMSSQVFTASGTFTTPATTQPGTKFKFTVVGAGGSGAGTAATDASASGGAAGATAIYYVSGLTASLSCTVTVGTGGAAPSAGLNNGNVGGNSSVVVSGVTVTANGGGAGVTSGSTSAPTGATGGTASNGTINIQGGDSGPGFPFFSASFPPPGSAGGVSSQGGGGKSGPGDNNGQAGRAFGSGGGGAGASNTNPFAGGAGKDGIVIVEWVI